MKTLFILAAAMSLLLFGCSSTENGSAPEDTLDFNIIGDDAPDSYAAAMEELAAIQIIVPDPVSHEQVSEPQAVSPDVDFARLERIGLDDNERPNFRRIVRHLHERFRALRECLENSDNRELHRIAYGAHLAFRRGMLALEEGRPRAALEAFHRANRMLNLAQRMCRGRG